MRTEKLAELYKKYSLDRDDVFKHKHYVIITRTGIDKIQAIANIDIAYEVVVCERDFCVVKANAQVGDKRIQTFGSALKGTINVDGNTTNLYVMEMAEKRAMSRAVLKLTGFYALDVYAEEESEEFKRNKS